jgi:5-methylcytosine-specific restriction endonuclease McrA
LILNATYEPLGVVSVRRAAILILSAKAICVADGDGILHSARHAMPVPSVIRLTRFVRVPYRAHVGLSRRAVFARDGGRCAYCRAAAETIDHIMPRSRGGRHTWENVVAACARCNHRKGDRTPAELGWRLHTVPSVPRGAAWRVLGHRTPDPRWAEFLSPSVPAVEPVPPSPAAVAAPAPALGAPAVAVPPPAPALPSAPSLRSRPAA